MQKAIPQNIESPFGVGELFFSRTDKKGIIASGNEVFARVSQFSFEELIGSPHNINRHPDMPKCVFKLLWDTISAGKPIGAYVKNMAKSGAYYWVFASVFPDGDEYLSIRLKPTSPFLQIVSDLYKKVLVEEKKGMEHGLKLILTSLETLGFKNYEQFMAAALTEEMNSRDKKMTESNVIPMKKFRGTEFQHLLESGESCDREFRTLFKALYGFVETSKSIKSLSDKMLSSFKRLNLLSINMAIGAERVGESGVTLAEVSRGFKDIADEIERQMKAFYKAMEEIQITLANAQFQISVCRLQTEMIHLFLLEMSSKIERKETFDRKMFDDNYGSLLRVSDKYSRNVLDQMDALSQTFFQFKKKLDDLSTSASGLEVIRISGKLETAKLDVEEAKNFNTHIEEMAAFVKAVKAPLTDISKSVGQFSSEMTDCSDSLVLIGNHLGQMRGQAI